MVAIAHATIRPQSKGTMRVGVLLVPDGPPDAPVVVTARATREGEAIPWVTCVPARVGAIPPGGQAVSLLLTFAPRDPAAPLHLSGDGVDLEIATAGGAVVARTHLAHIREWYRDWPAWRPADLAELPFRGDALPLSTLAAAYDGDERGALLFARPRGGGLIGLVAQVDGPPDVFSVRRWADFAGPAPMGGRPVHPGYTVPPGSLIDLATGRVAPPGSGPAADAIWEGAARPGGEPSLRPLNGAMLAPLRTPLLLPLAATRVFAQGNPHDGTARDWREIRDLFDNCDEEPYRAGFCVDDIWAPAAIAFRIVVRRDIQVPANLAQDLPVSRLQEFSRMHNLPGLLNVYFLRSVEAARAWGAADRDPLAPGRDGALWVGDRCGDADRACWIADVITIAHETGHFLTLPHRCDETGRGRPCRPADAAYLMYGDGTRPASRRLTGAEIARARQRAWLYRP